MIVVISGSSRGLGAALAQICLEAGDTVIACARHPETSEVLGSLVHAYSSRLNLFAMDVANEESVISCATEVAKRFPAVDVVINNAAVLLDGESRIAQVKIADIERSVNINTLGPIRVVRHFLPLLLKGDGRFVLNISSEAGSISTTGGGWYGYNISKAALNMFTQILGNDLRQQGVTALAVHPGRMRTEMGRPDFPDHPLDAARDLRRLLDIEAASLPPVRFTDRYGNAMPL